MTTRHYCDACDCLLEPANNFGKQLTIEHKFETDLGIARFDFRIGFGSDVNSNNNRIIQGDGDICKGCFRVAMISYVRSELAAVEDEDEQEGDEEIEEEEEEEEEYDPQEQEPEEPIGDDTGEV